MNPNRPATTLHAVKVERSLQRNILPAIHKKVNVLSCRALWQQDDEDISVIVDKRKRLDEIFAKINAVEFFILCITGTTTNCGKEKNVIRPAIGYFVSLKNNTFACEEELFKAIHDSDFDASVSKIKTSAASKDPILQSLKQVVKVKMHVLFLNYSSMPVEKYVTG